MNFPTVICLPTVCYFLIEATSEIYGPGSIFPSYIFRSILLFAFLFICIFYFQIYIIKNTKIPRGILFVVVLFAPTHLPIYQSFTREGLTTPLTRRVASIYSLCAGTVYIVLRGSPTSSITLIS